MKRPICVGKNFSIPLYRKYLRILLIASSISAIFWMDAGRDPSFAFSQKDGVLDKLKKTAVNFHEVTPGIYRSGLVSEKAAPLLKELGIKTVISFDDNRKRAEQEAEILRQQGIDIVQIPWSGWDYPDGLVIQKTLELMEDSNRRPVLVHCKHGQERTGVAIACWRIAHEGWSAEKAYQEMKAHGFRSFQYGHLKKYVYDFAGTHGASNIEIANSLEQFKTNVLSFFYQLRKLNPFLVSEPLPKTKERLNV